MAYNSALLDSFLPPFDTRVAAAAAFLDFTILWKFTNLFTRIHRWWLGFFGARKSKSAGGGGMS